MRDVEAVASDAHLPGRGDCARRGDNAVILKSTQGHARRRIALDIEVVEESGLKAIPVQRIEVKAAGALEDASVVATIDDGEWARLRHKRPCVRVGV